MMQVCTCRLDLNRDGNGNDGTEYLERPKLFNNSLSHPHSAPSVGVSTTAEGEGRLPRFFE